MTKIIIRLLIITGLILLIPLAGELFVEGWNWGVGGFIFAGVMIFGTGVLFEIGRHMSKSNYYRAGFALALLAGFMIIWGNMAVGFIGEDNPANVLYMLMLLVAFLAVIGARLKAQAVSYILFGLALGQILIPFAAHIFWSTDFEPGLTRILVLSAGFTGMWIVAALLFRQSTRQQLN